jgi:hypothetical protein
MVLAVPDEPDRGRKPVLRDEVAAVVAKQQYPRERLLKLKFAVAAPSRPEDTGVIRIESPQGKCRLCGMKWRPS